MSDWMAKSHLFPHLARSGLARVATIPVTGAAAIGTTWLTVHAVGDRAFGYIALTGTLFLLLPFADLGLGAAVINAVASRRTGNFAEAHALAVTRASLKILTKSMLVLIAISVTLGLSQTWSTILGIPRAYGRQADWAPAAATIIFALSLPFGLGQRILIGEQKNHIAAFLSVIGPVSGLGLTAILVYTRAPALWLAVAPSFGILLMTGAQWAYGLRTTSWSLARVLSAPALPDGSIRQVAAPMFVINIATPVAMQSGKIIISHIRAQDLASYSAVYQFYLPAVSVITTSAMAMWPIFSAARAHGDGAFAIWVKAVRTLAIAGGVGGVLFATLIGPLVSIASGGRIGIDPILAASFGALILVVSLHQPSGMFLTDEGGLRFQAKFSAALAALSLTFGVVGAVTLGATGVALGTALSVCCAQVLPEFAKMRRDYGGGERLA